VRDGEARFSHPDDPDPATFATTIALSATTSEDTVAFTTLTAGDACPALTWRLSYRDLNGQAFERMVQTAPDGDRDAVPDASDNCPAVYNPTQADGDGDDIGDACENENRPPSCGTAKASPAVLWPPNHGLVPVGISGVIDPDGGPVTIAVTGVRQDEPVGRRHDDDDDDHDDCHDNDHAPDAFLRGNEALLRAERLGQGNGRVYHLSFKATDADGASCTATVKTCVPHDSIRPCVDGGPLYDSTVKP
jgi:hypothetical protein